MRPTNSYALCFKRLGSLSIECESKKVAKARGAEKKTHYCLEAAKPRKKAAGEEGVRLERWKDQQSQNMSVPIPGSRGGLTLYVFLLKPCYVYPTLLGRRGAPWKQQHQHQQQHDTVMQVPPTAITRAVGLVNPFGYPPLSDGQGSREYRQGTG